MRMLMMQVHSFLKVELKKDELILHQLDPGVRKRGRGLGLDIIHGTMTGIAYHPGTEQGNITILDWDPRMVHAGDGEHRHA